MLEIELAIKPDIKLIDSLKPINDNGRISLLLFREYLETYGGFHDESTQAYKDFQRVLLSTSLDANQLFQKIDANKNDGITKTEFFNTFSFLTSS